MYKNYRHSGCVLPESFGLPKCLGNIDGVTNKLHDLDQPVKNIRPCCYFGYLFLNNSLVGYKQLEVQYLKCINRLISVNILLANIKLYNIAGRCLAPQIVNAGILIKKFGDIHKRGVNKYLSLGHEYQILTRTDDVNLILLYLQECMDKEDVMKQ